MKKIIYLFLVLPLIFSSCAKEDPAVVGCMDSQATNWNTNATEESHNICNYTGEVTYFLYKSASDAMIDENIPYVSFYDSFGNSVGTITYLWYYNSMSNVPCATTESTLHTSVTWSGNVNSNQANFAYTIYDHLGNYIWNSSVDVTPNACKLVGFTVTKEILEQLQNR